MENKMIARILFCVLLNVSSVVFGAQAIRLSRDLSRSYDNITCFLPFGVSAVPATIGVRPCTNGRELEIVPKSHANQKIDNNTWIENEYALRLDGPMMGTIDREIKMLLKTHPSAKTCLISLIESTLQSHRSLCYEIEVQSFIEQYANAEQQRIDLQRRRDEANKKQESAQQHIKPVETFNPDVSQNNGKSFRPIPGFFVKGMLFFALGYGLYRAEKLPESLMHFLDTLLPVRFLR